MTIGPMILLLLLPAQSKPKPDTPEDRARRAAIVDRVLGESGPPRIRAGRPAAEVEPPEPAPGADAPQAARARARAAAAREHLTFVTIRDQDPQGRVVTRTLTMEPSEPVAPAEADGELDPPEPIPPFGLNFDDDNMVLARRNFDIWVFGEGVDAEGRKARLQSRLAEAIDRVGKAREVDEAQLRKLRLAGGGDIKRFLDRVEVRRSDFEAARMRFNTGLKLLRDLDPLAREFREGPFGEDSLFAKMRNRIIGDL